MLVRMKVGMSGTINGDPWPPEGGVIDLPDPVGVKVCAAGQGEPVADRDADVETAVDPTPVDTRTVDSLDGLRADLEAAGVKVDKRWGEQRLRDELEAATAPEDESPTAEEE